MAIHCTVDLLRNWERLPYPEGFPYTATLAAVRRRGKHFMDAGVMAALKQARHRMQASPHHGGARQLLQTFLDVVLDKADDRYDYTSYTALPILEHARPGLDTDPEPRRLQHVHDVTLCSIMAEAIAFESNVLHGGESYLPHMVPDAAVIERRIDLALRSIEPALMRLGFADEAPASPPARSHHRPDQVVRFCRAQPFACSRFVLDASMMPVYTVHDEHLFIRILQALDATFASVVGFLEAALKACDDDPGRVPAFIRPATGMLVEGLGHFQTLSTMRRESFATFREFTTGASAIQSANYKAMESLCRSPDPDRLDSLAYASVPQLQAMLRTGRASLDSALQRLRGGAARPDHVAAIEDALRELSAAITRFRHAHYGIAKKYLGEGGGTGYTEGTPYLRMVRDIPVFNALPARAPR